MSNREAIKSLGGFRWTVITMVGAVYCFLAPRLYYRRRK